MFEMVISRQIVHRINFLPEYKITRYHYTINSTMPTKVGDAPEAFVNRKVTYTSKNFPHGFLFFL
jgi:hypothetical protein